MSVWGGRVTTWFPGHMAKATREIAQRLKPVDLVIELRDARIPLSSVSTGLGALIANKRRMIIMNKSDLANPNLEKRVVEHFANQGIPAVFASAPKPKSAKQILAAVQGLLREHCGGADTLLAMVVGVPNVGKSSLINAMRQVAARQGQALGRKDSKGPLSRAKMGPLPGVTRHLAGFQVGSKPSMYIMDTPGIMPPQVADEEQGLKIALTGGISDTVVGTEKIAHYLVWSMMEAGWKGKAGGGGGGGGGGDGGAAAGGGGAKGVGKQGGLVAALAKALAAPKEEGFEFESSVDEAKIRLEVMLHIMNAEEGAPRHAALNKLLSAYRKGTLGRHTLDQLPT